MGKNIIMGHLVIGYPTLEESFETALAYSKAGIEILELQFPFSHPTADGSVITQANRVAIEENNVTIEDCFNMLKRLKDEVPNQKIIPMTYFNKVFHYGTDAFMNKLNELGIDHIILPDLPFDGPLTNSIKSSTVKLVPVMAANISEERLNEAMTLNSDYIYLMADYQITGQAFSLNERLKSVIKTIRTKSNAQIGIGFGISTRADIEQVLEQADYAIIGSSLIKAKEANQLESKLVELL